MAILLFRLNGVPEDEADAVRALLDGEHIEYYETEAGRWGISVAAIWLRDESRLTTARRLIDDYQREREKNARETYEQLRREGRHDTLLQRIQREPVRLLLYAIAIAVILYFTIAPFLP